MPTPTMEIGQDKSGNFILIHHTVHPEFGVSTQFGESVTVGCDEMRRNGLKLVQRSLKEYPRRRYVGPSSVARLTPAARRRLFGGIHIVLAIADQPKVITLRPMHRNSRGALESAPEGVEDIRLALPMAQATFHSKLEEALRISRGR
jgi:hypothetical protein